MEFLENENHEFKKTILKNYLESKYWVKDLRKKSL